MKRVPKLKKKGRLADCEPDLLTVALHWREYVTGNVASEGDVVEEERPFAEGESGKVEVVRDSAEDKSGTHDLETNNRESEVITNDEQLQQKPR